VGGQTADSSADGGSGGGWVETGDRDQATLSARRGTDGNGFTEWRHTEALASSSTLLASTDIGCNVATSSVVHVDELEKSVTPGSGGGAAAVVANFDILRRFVAGFIICKYTLLLSMI